MTRKEILAGVIGIAGFPHSIKNNGGKGGHKYGPIEEVHRETVDGGRKTVDADGLLWDPEGIGKRVMSKTANFEASKLSL